MPVEAPATTASAKAINRPVRLGLLLLTSAIAIALASVVFSGDDVSPDELRTRHFGVTGVEGREIVSDPPLDVFFTRDHMRIRSQCAGAGGTYRIAGGRLWVEAPYAEWERPCDPDSTALNAWLATFLGGDPTITLQDDELVLNGLGARLVAIDTGDRTGTNPLP